MFRLYKNKRLTVYNIKVSYSSIYTSTHLPLNQFASRKKRLFLIINRLALSGGSTDALTMAFHLKEKYDVTVLYGEKEKDEKETPLPLSDASIQFIKIKTLHRSILPFKDLQSYRNILSLIRQYQPHIVHTHGFKSGLIGRITAKRASVPVIIHTYHGHIFHSYYNSTISRFIAFIERRLASISTRLVAISPHQAFELASIYRIAPLSKISTIFIGIDERKYTLQTVNNWSFRERYNIAEHTTIIAIISRLVTIKNPLFLLMLLSSYNCKKRMYASLLLATGIAKHPCNRKCSRKISNGMKAVQHHQLQ